MLSLFCTTPLLLKYDFDRGYGNLDEYVLILGVFLMNTRGNIAVYDIPYGTECILIQSHFDLA